MNYLKSYKFTLFTFLLTLTGILMPSSDIPSTGIPHIDKVVHFGMFATLTFVFYIEYRRCNKKLPKLNIPLLALGSYAALSELLQLLVPGRSCSTIDFIADLLGILSVICLFKCYTFIKK